MGTLSSNDKRQKAGTVKITDGVEFADITSDGELEVFLSAASSGVTSDKNYQIFEDTSFVAGESPVTLDFNTVLGRNATEFLVINDGVGNFTVASSLDGASFGGEKTMKNGEIFTMDKVSVDSLRLTRVADSSYRVVYL